MRLARDAMIIGRRGAMCDSRKGLVGQTEAPGFGDGDNTATRVQEVLCSMDGGRHRDRMLVTGQVTAVVRGLVSNSTFIFPRRGGCV